MRLADRVEESFRLRRLRRRAGFAPPPSRRDRVPQRPVGAKLELTYACNLRCDFCYTDSPRRTLERATDLTDDQWRDVVQQAIDLGIVEAVVTGGEPLLRRELTLELLETLDAAGIGVSFNTNGWFLDEAVADRLARLSGLMVHISIDGVTADHHDAARGVPGSWRRAVRAVDLLLDRGVMHSLVHVVTPLNQAAFGDYLEAMWRLGAAQLRVTPVVRSAPPRANRAGPSTVASSGGPRTRPSSGSAAGSARSCRRAPARVSSTSGRRRRCSCGRTAAS